MRQVVTIPDERLAKRLADHLLTLDVTTRVDRAKDGWIVWVHREEKMDLARREVDAFLANPEDPRYQGAAKVAVTVRREKAKAERRHARETRFLAGRLNAPSFARCPVTYTLIGLSLVVFVLTNMGYRDRAIAPFVLSPPVLSSEAPPDRPTLDDDEDYRFGGLDALRRGEVWRLVSPAVLHFGLIHLAFNMTMLYSLGSLVELRKGTLAMLALVVLIAGVASLSEYAWDLKTHEPSDFPWRTGGMSGVLYGLFAYCWMKSDYDADADMKVPTSLIVTMVLWLFVCMTGRVGPIANAAHVGGLCAGLLIGVAPHLFRERWW